MRNILTGTIQPPRIFLAPDEGGSGGGDDLSGVTAQPTGGHPDTTERVPGEKSPDFGKLSKPKTSAGTTQEPQKATPEVKKTEEPQKKVTEPEKKEPKQAAAEPQKTASTPQSKETPKAAEKVEKKAGEAPAKEEKPAGEVEIPEKDDDIDKIQANPGAPQAVVKSLNDMKSIVKQTRESARKVMADLKAAQTELEQAKANTGKLPPEVEAKVKRAEDILLTFEAENNEQFRQEYDGKIIKAEENLFTMLKGHGLSEAVIQEIKDAGVDSWPRWEAWKDADGNEQPGILDRLSGLTRRKVEDAILERERAIGAKRTKLQELASNREGAMKEFGEKEKQSRSQWADKAVSASNKLVAGQDWILEEGIPKDATEDERKAIESSNAEKKKLAEAWHANVRDAYNRDAERTAEIALKAVKVDYLTTQLEKAESELERATARIEELENRIGKVKSASRVAHTETTDTKPAAQEKKEGDGKIGGDGQDAIRNFKWGQGKK